MRSISFVGLVCLGMSSSAYAQTFPTAGTDNFPTNSRFSVTIRGLIYTAFVGDPDTKATRSAAVTEGTEGSEPVDITGCAVCKPTVADSDISCWPLVPPRAPPQRELHTEMLDLKMCSGTAPELCYLAGQPAADALNPTAVGRLFYRNSFGEVESDDRNGDSSKDFPATSFWSIHGVVTINPPPALTSGTFYTTQSVLMVESLNSLPPSALNEYLNAPGTTVEGGGGIPCGMLPVRLFDASNGQLVGRINSAMRHGGGEGSTGPIEITTATTATTTAPGPTPPDESSLRSLIIVAVVIVVLALAFFLFRRRP